MKYVILILGVFFAYVCFVVIAKSQDIPPTECEDSIGKIMEVAGLYITKEATLQQEVKDLKAIINEMEEKP